MVSSDLCVCLPVTSALPRHPIDGEPDDRAMHRQHECHRCASPYKPQPLCDGGAEERPYHLPEREGSSEWGGRQCVKDSFPPTPTLVLLVLCFVVILHVLSHGGHAGVAARDAAVQVRVLLSLL